MKPNLQLTCSLCGKTYTPNAAAYTCPACNGNLDVVYDYAALRKTFLDALHPQAEPSLWRYLPLLPVGDPGGEHTPLRAAGWTRMFSLPRLADALGLNTLLIKDESTNPTASFKDRASAVVVARAREIGAATIVTASTGNAGAALAGMAAAVGQHAVIFAPKSAPPAKVAQLLIFGAQVILVDGNYDSASALALEAAREFGWYCRNTAYNPFTTEGKKTAALEIWEQVRALRLQPKQPINLFVSVGDGNIISGIHKGFKDLAALGLLDDIGGMPRIYGVQAEGSAAISNAYAQNSETIVPVSAKTLADSIAVDLPADGVRAVRAARETGGAYVTVSDAEILQAIAELGPQGIFAEPAGAASLAGLRKALREGLNPQAPVILLNTGSGLKDVRAASQAVPSAPVIEPSLSALKTLLSR
ncbi:MAG: threonine synthase [Anaerolineales bacterium]